MDKPVVDMTGLNATTNYDLSLAITAEDYRTIQMRGALKSGITLAPEAAQLAEFADRFALVGYKAAGLEDRLPASCRRT